MNDPKKEKKKDPKPAGDEPKKEPKVEDPPATPDANPIDPRVFDRPDVGNRDAHRSARSAKK